MSIPKPPLSPNGAWWSPQKKRELGQLEQIMIIQTGPTQKKNKQIQFLIDTNIFDICATYKSVRRKERDAN